MMLVYSKDNNCEIYRPERTLIGEPENGIIKYESGQGVKQKQVNVSNASDYQLRRIGQIFENIPFERREGLLSEVRIRAELEEKLVKECRQTKSLPSHLDKLCKGIEAEQLEKKIYDLEIDISSLKRSLASYKSVNYEKSDKPYYKEDAQLINSLLESSTKFDQQQAREALIRAINEVNHPKHQLMKEFQKLIVENSSPGTYDNTLLFGYLRFLFGEDGYCVPSEKAEETEGKIKETEAKLKINESELMRLRKQIENINL